MDIIKEETYRSSPYVNRTDDMVRVTLHCKTIEWIKIKRELEKYISKGK